MAEVKQANVDLEENQPNIEVAKNKEASDYCKDASERRSGLLLDKWRCHHQNLKCLILLIFFSCAVALAVVLPLVLIREEKDLGPIERPPADYCHKHHKPPFQDWCKACEDYLSEYYQYGVMEWCQRRNPECPPEDRNKEYYRNRYNGTRTYCFRRIHNFVLARDKWISWSNETLQDYDYIYDNNVIQFRQGKKSGHKAAGNCKVHKELDESVDDGDCRWLRYGCGIDAKFRAIENYVNDNLKRFVRDGYNAPYHPRYGYPWYVSWPWNDVYTYMTPIVLYTIEQNRLDSAIQKWNSVAQGSNKYTYTALVDQKADKIATEIQRCCFDPEFDPCKLRSHGKADHIKAVVNTEKTNNSSEDDPTVTMYELFEIIQDAINLKNVHMLEVEYDEILGYPRTLFIGRGFDCFETLIEDRRRLYEDDSTEGWLGYVEHDGWDCYPNGWSSTLWRLNISDLSYWRAFFDYAFYMTITELSIV